jgi:hypothetical protein
MSACKGLHCPGCGDGGGAGAIIAAIIVIVLIGSAHAVARAAVSFMHGVEVFMIAAGIILGSSAALVLGGYFGLRSISRARARARARSSIPGSEPVKVTAIIRPGRPAAGLPPAAHGQAPSLPAPVWRARGEVPRRKLPTGRFRW